MGKTRLISLLSEICTYSLDMKHAATNTRAKPTVGDLVRLDKLAQKELGGGGYSACVGLVVECLGIRCTVNWTNGVTTRPQRSVLEIINASR